MRMLLRLVLRHVTSSFYMRVEVQTKETVMGIGFILGLRGNRTGVLTIGVVLNRVLSIVVVRTVSMSTGDSLTGDMTRVDRFR